MSKKIGMKKWAVLTLLLMCLTLLAGVPAASAAEGSGITLQLKVGSPNMTVNGVSQPIGSQGTTPVISGGVTYVPIKAIVEAFGGSIEFVSAEKKISIIGSRTINLWVGRTSAVVNGLTVTLDKGPYIMSGRTLVPLRFVANNLGCQVQWDGPTQTITINYTPPGAAPVDPGATPPADPGATPPVDPGTTTPAAPAADFSGVWQLVVEGEAMGTSVLVLEQSGSQVTGYYGYEEESGKAFSGTVTGNKLTGKFSTTNPVTEWDFEATMSAAGNSFSGKEYYSNPAWDVHGVKQ